MKNGEFSIEKLEANSTRYRQKFAIRFIRLRRKAKSKP